MTKAKPVSEHMPAGRPSKYTPQLADEICRQLMIGESLIDICAQDDMPDRFTVIRWTRQDPDFAAQLYEARQAQADLMDDLVLSIAKRVQPETANADAVRLKALTWRAARLNAKRYGDKTEQTSTVKHEVTHIHLVAPESDQVETTIDADFTLLPHPLEQQDDD